MKYKSKILRIIDANVNRAMEGMRVVEEIARLVLDNKKISRELKNLRGDLQQTVKALPDVKSLVKFREAMKDVGRKISTEMENRREGLEGVFQANIKRAQEATRVLEEFSKSTGARSAKSFKALRFKLYDVEKKIKPLILSSKRKMLDFDLYVVSDPLRSHLEAARGVIRGGGKIFQLRDKGASKKKYLQLAKAIRKLTKKAKVAFIVNDHLDIAQLIDADGIHLGQDDIPIPLARKLLGEEKIIGFSTHSFAQAVKAEKAGADYISFGPIFQTPSKPKTKPLGLKALKRVVKRIKIPVVAIGGISESNIHDVRKTGCQRIAVIRAASELRLLRRK